MSLYQYLVSKRDRPLRVFDWKDKAEFLIPGAEITIPSLSSRSLAFVYLDGSGVAFRYLAGFLKSPHVCVLLNAGLNTELKQSLEAVYRPKLVLDLEQTSSRFQGNAQAVVSEGDFIVWDTNAPPTKLAPGLKILLSTSGVTGSPKLVKLSDQNFITNAESIARYLPIVDSDVCPLNLPSYYAYGLSLITSNWLAGGMLHTSIAAPTQREFWNQLSEGQFTSFAGTPYVYDTLAKFGFLKKTYPSLRYLSQAGGKMPEPLLEKYAAYAKVNCLPFYVMYGQTEAAARISYLEPERLADKFGSIGKPIANGNLIISEDGELVYKGPNVGGGYAESLNDLSYFEPLSELKTGDLARVDEEGFYFIIGRKKRVVKLFGNRINLDEIEAFINKHWSGSGLYCTGKDDSFLLLFSEAPPAMLQQIQAELHQRFLIHPSFQKYVCINPLPVTDNGKINYTAPLAQIV